MPGMTSDATNSTIISVIDATASTDATVTLGPFSDVITTPFFQKQKGVSRRPTDTERSQKKTARKQARASKRRNRR